MNYLYIVFLFLFIIWMAYWNTHASSMEGFDNNKIIVLLGDSILKNDAYVSDGKSVEQLVKTTNKTYCFAEDHSTISDMFTQVTMLPIDLNNKDTYIFLSAGGNNILSHYVEQNNDCTDSSMLKPMFSIYKKLVKSIQTRLPEAKINLLDIYYPDNLRYKQFHPIIQEWNGMIYEFAKNPQNNIYGVIKISNHLTQNEDFSFGIEPSSSGGKKIAELLLSSY